MGRRTKVGLRFWLALAAAASAGGVGACARQGVPPGGPEDRRPPVVVATVPDTFAVLTEPFRGPVRFDFDERVSERVSQGTLDQAVVVSPQTGDVRVQHGRQSISVEMSGGFKPGLVYRVTLLPVVQDLFNNTLLAPFELVFSTGGDFNASAVAGQVWDRVTAEGVEDLSVQAFPVGGDSVPQVARTDSSGVYVLRYLPAGEYHVVAFQDRNRNGVVDPMELQGENTFQVAGADTTFLDVPVLQPDTAPARLIRATVLDSVTVLLEFDKYLDPLARSDLFGVTVTEDSTGASIRADVFHEREYVAWAAQLQDSFAKVDSLEAARRAEDALEDVPLSRDTAQADSAAAQPSEADSAQAAPAVRPGPGPARPQAHPGRPMPPPLPRATGGGRSAAGARSASGSPVEVLTPDGRPLPARRLVLRLGEFLVVNQPYTVSVVNATSINGVGLGGGESPVIREPPPPDTTQAQDSTAVGDSAAALPDTTGVAPDSAGALPDSAAVQRDTVPNAAAGTTGGGLLGRPDSTGTTPDSTGVPPDTTRVTPDSTGTAPDSTGAPPDTTRVGRAPVRFPPGRSR